MNVTLSAMRSRCVVCAMYIGIAVSHGGEFGVVTKDGMHEVDSGAGLVFRVLEDSGAIRSIKLDGRELTLPGRRLSGINSGVGSEGTRTGVRRFGDTVVVYFSTDRRNRVVSGLTHYYIVRRGENVIYLATHAENEPGNGELRWITRLDSRLFPDVPVRSDIRDNTGNIESRDVFGREDGTTRSKYYGNQRAIDLGIRGVTGEGVGVFMVHGGRESSSGGPFFRDIQNQTGSAAEVYNYMNSGHNQTEDLRLGVLYGPYALCFTDGSKPPVPDMGFVSRLGLKGFVGERERGSVAVRRIEGMARDHAYTLGFANGAAQYWASVPDSGGPVRCDGMKPGKYAMSVYKGELVVQAGVVEVERGRATTIGSLGIAGDPSAARPVWRIGDWDGTPLEFRNGANIPLMHPSDVRQADWNDDTFVVGRSKAADFPACQWKAANGSREIRFWMDDGKLADATVRIGITAAFAGGRPAIRLNEWEPRRLPGPSSQPKSRSLTIGTYRGNNATFTYEVPASAFVVGENTLTVSPISGQSGDGFLSSGYAIDCVDLIPRPEKP